MDYEKKYKEALEKARQLCAYPTTKPFISDLQDLFPELIKESEDEKIKNTLIDYFKDYKTQEEVGIKTFFGIPTDNILAWLEKHGKSNPYSGVSFEYNGNIWGMCARDNGVDIILNRELIQHISIEKQDEQKSKNESTDTCDSLIIKSKEFPASEKRDFGYFSETADKVEPKFKVGDWIVDSIDTVCQIKEIEEDRYLLEFYNSNGVIPVKISIIDNDCHLWTIQDAKDGNVLEFSDHGRLVVGIVSHVNKTTGKVDVNCLLEYNNFKVGNYYNLDTIKPHPATKEQRNTLMKAMADAGYTFDFKKKKLNKIESDLTEFENTLADVCRGWIGEELGWKDYIIKNSLPLLELAKKQFDEYEQKPDNKIAPKFKVGDWITNGDYTWKIVEVKPLDYILQSQDGNIVDDTISHVDEQFHSFTIEDAKDGDVLAEDSCIFIIEKMKSNGTAIVHCCLFDDGEFDLTGSTLEFDVDSTHPATKEERDTLMKAMADADYTFDFEKKELKKIEQKSNNKAEPKFKAGNWYQCTKDFFGKGVTFDKNTAYYCAIEGCLQNEYGCHIAIVKDLYDNFKLWTIQDAKDGDVLHSTGFHNDCIFIFNGLDNWKFDEPNGDRAVATGYCCLFISADNMEFGIQGPDCIEVDNVKPATKIQRNLLFQKIKEAGYEWDADKKELKKVEQKPAWSEKDEEMLEDVRDNFEFNKGVMTDALIAQYDRFFDKIKFLKPHPKQEWSEEDEDKLKSILFHIEDVENKDVIDWLKSLKDRYTWKPSEEQMKVLKTLVEDNNQRYFYTTLNSLYEQLKRLVC